MADVLYVKTADGPVKVDVGGATVKTLVSSLRSAVLKAGDAFAVPEYTLGDNSLAVFWNGLLLAKGTHYAETTTTAITFTFDLAVDDVVVVKVYTSAGVVARTVQTDVERSAVISAGTAYTVPSHPMLEGKIQVFLDGLQYTDFTDASATTITFDIDIPTTTEIVCIVG